MRAERVNMKALFVFAVLKASGAESRNFGRTLDCFARFMPTFETVKMIHKLGIEPWTADSP